MKKLIYILTMVSLLAGCVKLEKEDYPVVKDSKKEVERTEGKKVRADFVVTIPGSNEISTKARGETPAFDNFYVAVFDENGMLCEYTPVAAQNVAGNGIENATTYSVSFTSSENQRILHFIANGPTTLPFGSEAEVIGGLKTSTKSGDHEDAYWQRIVVPHLKADPSDESKLHPDALNEISLVCMIRNFCKITISASTDVEKFVIKGFYTINTMNEGSIAPYNKKTGTFVNQYQSYDDVDVLIAEEDYHANVPTSAELEETLSEFYEITGGDNTGSNTAYIYEREVPTAKPTYVIVKGRFYGTNAAGKDTYYKIDLLNNQSKYFPFLRNFSYTINVQNVKRDGSDTPEEALHNAGSGDLSTSLEAQSLTNISDGKSRLFVDYTEKVLVGSDAVLLRYKYIPKLTLADEHGVAIICNDYVDITRGEHGATGSAIDHFEVAATDAPDGFREVWVYPTPVSSAIKYEDLILTGGAREPKYMLNGVETNVFEGEDHSPMVRDIKYYLREKLNMRLALDPDSITPVEGQATTLTIKIPDGLPSSIFSLDFLIEAQNLTLTTNNDPLPVKTDPSIIDGNDKPAFQFLKTITWSEYETARPDADGFKSFTCKFKSNQAESATNIYVDNEFFHQSRIYLGNYDGEIFDNLTFSKTTNVHEGDVVTFSAELSDLPEIGDITVKLKNFIPSGNVETHHLTQQGVDGDYGIYKFPTSCVQTDNGRYIMSFPLKVDNNEECDIKLSAYHFAPNSASLAVSLAHFSDWSWEGKPRAAGETLTFKFKIDALPQTNNGNLKVVLTNAVPAQNEHLTPTGEANTYYYTPTGTNETVSGILQSFQLSTVAKGEVTVVIADDHFENSINSSVIASKTITIPAGLFLKNDTASQYFGNDTNGPSNGSIVAVQTTVKKSDFMNTPAGQITINQTYDSVWDRWHYVNSNYKYSNKEQVTFNVESDVNRIYLYYLNGQNLYSGSIEVDDNGNLINISNNTVKMTLKVTLSAPTNLRVTGRTNTSINLSWNQVNSADHYIVSVTPLGGGNTVTYDTYSDATSLNIGSNGHGPSLSPDTKYVITVKAINYSTGAESAESDALTDQTKGKLSTPVFTSITSTAKTMTFEWAAVTNATKYDIKVYGPDGDALFTSNNNVTSTTFKVTGLTSEWKYYYAILTAIGDDKYDNSDSARDGTTTTHQSILPAPADDSLQCTSQQRSKLTFTWNAVEHAAGYHVQLLRGNTVVKEADTDGNTTSYTFKGLSSNTEYTFQVKTKGDNDCWLDSDNYSSSISGHTTTTKIVVDIPGTHGEANKWLTLIGDDVLTSASVSGNENYRMVVKQSATLTVYVNDSEASVKINGTTATQGEGSFDSVVDHETYYPYYVSYTAPGHTDGATSGSTQTISINAFNGEATSSASIAVYEMRKGTQFNSSSSLPSGWIILNDEADKKYYGFIYKNNTSLSANNGSPNYYDYNYLFNFTGTVSSTKMRNAAAAQYVVGTNDNFSFNNTGTNYILKYSNSSVKLWNGRDNNSYLWGRNRNSSTVKMKYCAGSNPIDDCKWQIYSVQFLAP